MNHVATRSTRCLARARHGCSVRQLRGYVRGQLTQTGCGRSDVRSKRPLLGNCCPASIRADDLQTIVGLRLLAQRPTFVTHVCKSWRRRFRRSSPTSTFSTSAAMLAAFRSNYVSPGRIPLPLAATDYYHHLVDIDQLQPSISTRLPSLASISIPSSLPRPRSSWPCALPVQHPPRVARRPLSTTFPCRPCSPMATGLNRTTSLPARLSLRQLPGRM